MNRRARLVHAPSRLAIARLSPKAGEIERDLEEFTAQRYSTASWDTSGVYRGIKAAAFVLGREFPPIVGLKRCGLWSLMCEATRPLIAPSPPRLPTDFYPPPIPNIFG